MGGLVGSLYAMGWTATEMEELLKTLDWELLLSGSAPYGKLSYRRKDDVRQFPSQLELGLKKGLTVPGGLNSGHFIGLLFDRLTLPYAAIDSFDDLPIPFRCVATDMEDGRPVVMGKGGLSSALRATMAIPGVFNPVERDGRILADGGLLDNLPADVAKQMGADIVIAVQVGSPLEDREQLESLLGVVNHSITIMILENVRRSQQYADIILNPEIAEFGTLAFERALEIVEKGYDSAEQKRVLLESLTLAEVEWPQVMVSRTAKRRHQLPVPSSLVVNGVQDEEQLVLQRRLEPILGKEIVPNRLEESLTSFYGNGRYSSLGYSIQDASSLVVHARRKGHGPPFVRFGFLVDGSEFDNVKFGIRSRFSFFDLGGFGSELVLDASVGTPLGIFSEYYRPVHGNWFVAPRGQLNRSIADIFQDGERIAEYRADFFGGGVDFGYGFDSQKDELRVGYDIGHTSMGVRIGQELPLPNDGTNSVFSIRYVHDGQDDAVIPRHGVRLKSSARYYLDSPGATEELLQVEASLSVFHRLSRKNSLVFRGSGGSTIQNDAPFHLQFTLGGPSNLGAYSREELRGSRFFYASGGLTREIAELSLLVPSKVFLGGWYEVGSVFDRSLYEKLRHSVSAGIFLDSFLGPLFLGGSLGDGKRGKIYFLLGRLF
jgi:NTE family protein